jgi:hypothetical protein
MASNAQAEGITVTPMVIDKTLTKPTDPLPPVKVTNGTNKVYDVSISFRPLGHDHRGVPLELSDSFKFSGHKMLSANKTKFRLKPGESTSVNLTLKIPGGRTGGAYAVMYVLAEPAESAADAKQTFKANIRMAVAIALGLPGTAKRSYTLGKPNIQAEPNGDVIVMVPATNGGDGHVRVGGTAKVKDPKGKELAALTFEEGNVYPTMTRYIKAVWRGGAKKVSKGTHAVSISTTAQGLPPQTASASIQGLGPGSVAQQKANVVKFPTAPSVKNRPITLEATVANQGNVGFAPVGQVKFIRVGELEPVATATLSGSGSLAPNQKTALKGALAKGLGVGTYKAVLNVQNDAGFPIATYSSTLQVIEKEIKLAGTISKFKAPSAKEPYLTLEFQNGSNVDVDADGVVLVNDAGGNVVGQVILERRRVSAGKSTLYNDKLPEGLDSGAYELRATINYGGPSKATSSLKHYIQ